MVLVKFSVLEIYFENILDIFSIYQVYKISFEYVHYFITPPPGNIHLSEVVQSSTRELSRASVLSTLLS